MDRRSPTQGGAGVCFSPGLRPIPHLPPSPRYRPPMAHPPGDDTNEAVGRLQRTARATHNPRRSSRSRIPAHGLVGAGCSEPRGETHTAWMPPFPDTRVPPAPARKGSGKPASSSRQTSPWGVATWSLPGGDHLNVRSDRGVQEASTSPSWVAITGSLPGGNCLWWAQPLELRGQRRWAFPAQGAQGRRLVKRWSTQPGMAPDLRRGAPTS